MKAASSSTLKRLGVVSLLASLLTVFVFLLLLPQDTMASPRQSTDQTTDITVWQESFETDGINARYTATEVCTDGSGDYFTRSDGSNIGSWIEFTGTDGNYFYAAQDTDGSPCTMSTEVITFSTTNITGVSSLQFSGLFAEDESSDGNEDWDANSLVYVEYSVDGGSWTKILQFAAAGGTNTEPRQDTNFDGTGDGMALTPAFTEYTADIPQSGASLDLRLTIINLTAGDEDVAFDNLRIVKVVPSFKIAKSAPTTVGPSQQFTYTITLINNTGISTTGTIITDAVPTNATFISASDGGVESGGVVSWTIAGNFVAGTSIERTFMVTATASSGTDIINAIYAVHADNWMTSTMGSPITTTTTYEDVCGASYIPIYDIQGNTSSSPVVGQLVSTEGVVTAVYQDANQAGGFYIQDETGDGDATTSDGIFIYTPITTTIGDAVRIAGTVVEFSGFTEIGSVTSMLKCGTGTITPTNVSLPVPTLDTWEQYEGMLVDFPQGLYVTEHYNLGRYGEISLSVNDRLYNPTNITIPGVDANAQQELNDRSRIQLDDTYTNQNRDPIAYPNPGLSYTNTLRNGDYVATLTGVLDTTFGRIKVQPINTTTVSFTHTNSRTVAPPTVGGDLTVASFNVLNYFTTFGSRGADNQFEFDRQRIKIINAIVAIDADVIGLMEIENNGYGAGSAIQDLVDGLNTATAPGTYAFVDPGAPIGSDAIAVGLLYQPANVILAGGSQILDSSVISTFNDDKNRPALAQSFTFTEDVYSKTVTIAVNHLKSKGSTCSDIGDPDAADGQGNCNLTRTSAAEALTTWLATDPTSSGSAYNLIIGDLNAYAMEDPITAIKDAGYTNLLSQYGGLYAYSYVFSGQHGYLDHALSNAVLTPFITGATTWNINADEPRTLDYNEEFKTPNQIISLYGDGPYRASDHDPVIIGLSLLDISITSPTDNADFVAGNNITATVPVTVSAPGFDIPTDGHWHLYVDGTPMGAIMGYTATVDLSLGAHTVEAELRDASHAPLGPTDIVTVTVSPADGIIILDPMENADYIAANNITATVPVTISTPGFDIPTDGHWHLYVDGTPMGAIMAYTATVDLSLGTHTVEAELRDASHAPLGPTDIVTVTVSPADGIIILDPMENVDYIATNNITATVPVTVSTPGFTIPTDGHWHVYVDGNPMGVIMGYTTTLELPLGEHTITAELRDPSHAPLGPTDMVTFTVSPADGIIITSPISGTKFVAANNITATVPVTVSTPGFTIPTNGYWEISVDGAAGVAIMDYMTTLELGLGEHTILATLMDSDDNPLGPTDMVTITVVPADGLIILSPADGEEFVAMNNITATVPVTASTPGFTIPTNGYWEVSVDGAAGVAIMDYMTTLDLAVGEHTILATLIDSDDNPLGPTDMVTITVTLIGEISITSPISGTEFVAMNNITATVPVTVNTTLGFDIPADGYWMLSVDGTSVGSVMEYATAVDLTVGEHIIFAELVDGDGNSLNSTDMVTITVRPWQNQVIYLPLIMNN